MTAPEDLAAALEALLEALPTVEAYTGGVPDKPPAEATTGRVYPYAVLWAGAGGSPFEAAVAGPGGLDWEAQVTVAAGDPTWCLQAITAVRAAVTGQVLVPGAGPLVDLTPKSLTVQRDEDPTPVRWFLPLIFGCLTP